MSFWKTLGSILRPCRHPINRPVLSELDRGGLAIRSWLLALFSSLVFALEAPAGFLTAPTYPAGTKPWTLAVADFNGDGIADLAVVDYGVSDVGAGVSILLGNGDGTFQAPNSYLFGHTVYGAKVADFNGDGRPDLAVTSTDNVGNGTVTIFLGNGDGTFQALPSFIGAAAAVGDFNGDGIPDLIGNDGSSQYKGTIWLGKGDGTFQAPQSLPGGAGVVGDFNGDGILDLAVLSYGGTVTIWLGNGDGTFQVGQTYPIGQSPWFIVVADFNGDGIADLAVAHDGDGAGGMPA